MMIVDLIIIMCTYVIMAVYNIPVVCYLHKGKETFIFINVYTIP